MSKDYINITTPVGRIIGGSCTEPRTEDSQGNPLIFKKGANIGQPRVEYSIGLAIPKTQADWKQELWAQPILQAATRDFPHLFSTPGVLVNPAQKFAFKVTDGDSTMLNSNGNRPCDSEGAPGNWVVWFANGYAPKLYTWDTAQNKAVTLAPGEEIKRGFYAEVYGSVSGNGAAGDQAGIFINLSMVCMRGYGPEIMSGPTVDQAGFGGGALPAGASTMPVGGTQQTPPANTQQTPPPPANTQQTPPPPANDLVNGPGATAPPPPPPPAVENYSYNGVVKTRDEWSAAGWNDAQIDANCTKV